MKEYKETSYKSYQLIKEALTKIKSIKEELDRIKKMKEEMNSS